MLVFGNFWIAFAALSLHHTVEYLQSSQINFDLYSLMIFFSTLFAYNLFRLNGLSKKVEEPGLLISWLLKNKSLVKIIIGSSFLISAFLFLILPDKYFFRFLLIGVFSIMYLFPVFRFRSKVFSFLTIPFLKAFIIGVIWTLLISINLPDNYILMGASFFFISGLTVAFDIRDIYYDEINDLRTFANQFGISKTKWVSVILLFISLILFYLPSATFSISILAIIPIIISMIIIVNLKKRSPEWIYTFALDGSIVLQFLLFYFYFRIA